MPLMIWIIALQNSSVPLQLIRMFAGIDFVFYGDDGFVCSVANQNVDMLPFACDDENRIMLDGDIRFLAENFVQGIAETVRLSRIKKKANEVGMTQFAPYRPSGFKNIERVDLFL